MNSKVQGADCNRCPFHAESRMVQGFGASPDKAKVVIVGEAPGNLEIRYGLPFVGPSGDLIRTLLKYARFVVPTSKEVLEDIKHGGDGHIAGNEVYFTNASLCYPGRTDAVTFKTSSGKKQSAMCCKGRLMEELQPYLDQGVPICAVGGSSTLALTGYDAISKMRGKWYKDGTVLCTWHPAYVLRQPVKVGELARDIKKLGAGKPAYLDFPKVKVIYIDTVEKMQKLTDFLIRKCADGTIPQSTVCMDIETRNIHWLYNTILCIQISWEVSSGAVITEEIIYTSEVKECLIRLFDRTNGINWVGHNFKFDMRFLKHQLGINNIWTAYDTLIADYCLDENKRHALKPILEEMYDLPDYEQGLVLKYLKNKNDDYGKVPRPQLYEYGVMDTAYTLRLWYDLRARLETTGMFETPFLYPLMASQVAFIGMELHGVLIDRKALYNLSNRLTTTLTSVQLELEEMAKRKLNLNSHVQVSKVMYGYYKMPVFKAPTKSGRSTAEKYRNLIMSQYLEQGLSKEGHEPFKWISMYAQWKKMEKIRSSYVDNVNKFIDDYGRVHPDILIYGTETGRLSIRNPALQTIPRTGTGEAFGEIWGKAIKSCYIVPDGFKIVQVDYSQAEMRTATSLSKDPFLMRAYQDGIDVHGSVAELWWPGWKEMNNEDTMVLPVIGTMDKKTMRVQAKKAVFARMYLGTEHAIGGILGISAKRAKPYLKKVDTLLSGLVKWEHAQFELMKKQGYVTTLTGRRRRIPLINRNNRDEARKAACNAPVQGTASDLTLESTVAVHQWLRQSEIALCSMPFINEWMLEHFDRHSEVHILITVHDSILLEVPDDLVRYISSGVKHIMEWVGNKWMPDVPWIADIEVGQSWGSLKDYK